MSRGKQREPFEGARRSGEVDETLKLTHKLTAVDEGDVIQGDAIETAKGFPAVDWSIDDDLVIELPGAAAPTLAVTPEIELDDKDLVDYKVELDDKGVIGLDDVGIIGPIDDVGIKFDGVDGESTLFDHKFDLDLDITPVFEEFDAQWSAGAESALRDMSPELDELVELADPIDLQGFDG